jgi:hypothetical protein
MSAEEIIYRNGWIKPCDLNKLSDIKAGPGANSLREHMCEAFRKFILRMLRKKEKDVTVMGIWGCTRGYVRSCSMTVILVAFTWNDEKRMMGPCAIHRKV